MAGSGRRELPRLGRGVVAVLLGVLLAVCVGVGLGMRMSLTDYGSNSHALDALTYQPTPTTEGMASLYSSRDILQEMDEVGMDSSSADLEGGARNLVMAMDNVGDLAPIIVVGTFTGNRSYVYEAFRCEVRISSVIKGGELKSGDVITVLDPFMIREPGFFSDSGGMFSSERIVSASQDNYSGGMAPMREGQEYLLFIERKYYPEAMNPRPAVTYILVNHPYARIPTDIAAHPERTRVIDESELTPLEHDWGTEYVMPQMSFAEACGYDVFVWEDEVGALYRKTCEALLARYGLHSARALSAS